MARSQIFDLLDLPLRDCAALAESLGVPKWRAELAAFTDATGRESEDTVTTFQHLLDALAGVFDEAEAAFGPVADYVTGYAVPAEALDVLGSTELRP